MFENKRIAEIEEDLILMTQDISVVKIAVDSIRNSPQPPAIDIENILASFRNEIEARLIAFHKEITDKCFSSMETIMRYTKEVSLIETLASQIKDKDLAALQTALLYPVISQRYEKEKEDKVQAVCDNVSILGEEIIKKRDSLQQEYLILNRQKKDTKEIETRLEILNWIIERKNDTTGKVS